MKSFLAFISEGKKPPDFSDEKSHELVWNHVVGSLDKDSKVGKKVRRALKASQKADAEAEAAGKDKEKAKKAKEKSASHWKTIETEVNNAVEKSKNDPDHPLHFDKQGDDGFTGKKKTDKHRDAFNSRIERSKHGIISMMKSRQGSSMASKGWKVTQQGGQHQKSKEDWGGNPGGQGRTDLVYTDPKNPKAIHRQSQKDVGGSQAYSAGGDQFTATMKAAAKEITKPKFHTTPRKEKGESDKDYKSRVSATKVAAKQAGKEKEEKIGRQAARAGKLVDAMKGKSSEEKQRLKGLAKKMTDRMEKENPGLSKAAGQEALTGKKQFGNKVDTVITTGDERSKVKDPRGTAVGEPRPALPKDKPRGGNIKGDIKAEPKLTKKRLALKKKSTYADFMRNTHLKSYLTK